MKNSTKMNKNFTNPEFIPYGTNSEIDRLIDSENPEERAMAANLNYALDKLVNDDNCYVRCSVVLQGYGLDR